MRDQAAMWRGSRGRRTPRQVEQARPQQGVYHPGDIVDAPEHYEYARAMGLLTWSTWDAEVRSFGERLRDFLQACPPETPVRFQGSLLVKSQDGEYDPAPEGQRLERLEAVDHSFGSLTETLARYGLKRRGGPEYLPRDIEVGSFREVTRVRNQRLRAIHGRVDIEAENMDEAKVAELERLEKKRAADQIREARERMRREVNDETGGKSDVSHQTEGDSLGH